MDGFFITVYFLSLSWIQVAMQTVWISYMRATRLANFQNMPSNYSQLKDFLSNKFRKVSQKKSLERIGANNPLQAYIYGYTGWFELKIV